MVFTSYEMLTERWYTVKIYFISSCLRKTGKMWTLARIGSFGCINLLELSILIVWLKASLFVSQKVWTSDRCPSIVEPAVKKKTIVKDRKRGELSKKNHKGCPKPSNLSALANVHHVWELLKMQKTQMIQRKKRPQQLMLWKDFSWNTSFLFRGLFHLKIWQQISSCFRYGDWK